MAASWGTIASRFASLGLTNLAREAVSYGAEAEARQREDLRRRAEAEQRERDAQEAAKRVSPTAAMAALQIELRSLSPQQLESLWIDLVAYLRAGAGGQVSVRGQSSSPRWRMSSRGPAPCLGPKSGFRRCAA